MRWNMKLSKGCGNGNRGDEAGNKLEEELPALTDQTDSRGRKQCKVVLGRLASVKDDVMS